MSSTEHDSMGKFVFEIVKMFVLAAIIILPIRIFIFQPFIVRGASMEPNFHEKEYLIVNEWGYKNVNLLGGAINVEPKKFLEREDIAVFRSQDPRRDFYIKRVIGLPGERVVVANGKVRIYNNESPDGRELAEAYLPTGRYTNGDIDFTLANDEYFVLGDNRGASSDSRSFGPVHRDDVIGRVFLRAFPVTEIDVF